jgi:hypothetical protein
VGKGPLATSAASARSNHERPPDTGHGSTRPLLKF